MTEKFKKAVKDVVADGIVTPEEETLILNLATEEGISENDARIYLIGEIKKIKEKRNGNRKTNWETVKPILEDIGKGVGTVLTIIGGIFVLLEKVDERKNNKPKE